MTDKKHLTPDNGLGTSVPHLIVIDSIQMLYSKSQESTPGSVAQLRECVLQLVRLAKEKHIAMILIGHVTKEDMKRLNVISPSMMIRKRFDDLIAPIFERIFSNITDSRTLAETRDLLLPKLMSGEIRVRA